MQSGKEIVATPLNPIENRGLTNFGLANDGDRVFAVGGYQSGIFTNADVDEVCAYDV